MIWAWMPTFSISSCRMPMICSMVFLALGAAFGDHARDLLVLVWLQIEERQVLQLPLDGVDAQAVRDGRIDLQRLARLEDAAIFVAGLASVRMLCRRSASLMTMTRMSLLMATNILRMVCACSSDRLSTSMREILVTPSTRCAMRSLKVSSTSASVTSESSTVSWMSAAHSVSTSMRRSARMSATSTGCTMNGSPLLRHCPLCAMSANENARASSSSSSSDR